MAPKQTTASKLHPLTIATRNFGSITVRPDQIIMLSPGLLGFSQFHRYVLIEHQKESPFLWLQCVDNPDLAFVVIDPAFIVPDYQMGPLEEIMTDLAVKTPQDLKVLVILTIPPGQPQEMTANLLGPVVINLKDRRGKQLVVETTQYSHQHRVLPSEN
ncbi:MAG: flagellar assembly protein FliW [Thermodesulfobacteriota bacterium]